MLILAIVLTRIQIRLTHIMYDYDIMMLWHKRH
jgi:hypothetical protein